MSFQHNFLYLFTTCLYTCQCNTSVQMFLPHIFTSLLTRLHNKSCQHVLSPVEHQQHQTTAQQENSIKQLTLTQWPPTSTNHRSVRHITYHTPHHTTKHTAGVFSETSTKSENPDFQNECFRVRRSFLLEERCAYLQEPHQDGAGNFDWEYVWSLETCLPGMNFNQTWEETPVILVIVCGRQADARKEREPEPAKMWSVWKKLEDVKKT